MAVFLQVSQRDPNAARFTKDVDVAIDRRDLQHIAEVAEEFGFRYRHVAGVDMLVNAENPKARSAVHFVFVVAFGRAVPCLSRQLGGHF
jgi:hypothetical protein